MGLSEEDEGWQRAGDAVNHTHDPLKWCWCLNLGAWCEPACLSTDLTTKRSCKRLYDSTHDNISITVFAFTFMHLADTFIQGQLALHSGYMFYQLMLSLGIKLMLNCLSYEKFVYSIFFTDSFAFAVSIFSFIGHCYLVGIKGCLS